MSDEILDRAAQHFQNLVKAQLDRVEQLKQAKDWIDYSQEKPITVGFCWGDGIGPNISQDTERVLQHLLEDEIKSGKLEFRTIDGLTIENRVKHMQAIPDDVLEELQALSCD
ncbi:MAG: hypothetical protein U5R06_08840 [candidate division KSB1 bacterium]|nr:hypothetical protein [candidate division KSB1 bacterium]